MCIYNRFDSRDLKVLKDLKSDKEVININALLASFPYEHLLQNTDSKKETLKSVKDLLALYDPELIDSGEERALNRLNLRRFCHVFQSRSINYKKNVD